jgi:hypothetical protein
MPHEAISTAYIINSSHRSYQHWSLSNFKHITLILIEWPCGTIHPQKLALTSPTSGGRSVGIVRSQTKATEFICNNIYETWNVYTTLPQANSMTFISNANTIASQIVVVMPIILIAFLNRSSWNLVSRGISGQLHDVLRKSLLSIILRLQAS